MLFLLEIVFWCFFCFFFKEKGFTIVFLVSVSAIEVGKVGCYGSGFSFVGVRLKFCREFP